MTEDELRKEALGLKRSDSTASVDVNENSPDYRPFTLQKQKTPTKSHFSEPEGLEDKGLVEFNKGDLGMEEGPDMSIGGRSKSDSTLNKKSQPKFDLDPRMTPVAETENEDCAVNGTPKKDEPTDEEARKKADALELQKKADAEEMEDIKKDYAGRENDQDLLSSVNKIGAKFRAKKLAEKERAAKLQAAKEKAEGGG